MKRVGIILGCGAGGFFGGGLLGLLIGFILAGGDTSGHGGGGFTGLLMVAGAFVGVIIGLFIGARLAFRVQGSRRE